MNRNRMMIVTGALAFALPDVRRTKVRRPARCMRPRSARRPWAETWFDRDAPAATPWN